MRRFATVTVVLLALGAACADDDPVPAAAPTTTVPAPLATPPATAPATTVPTTVPTTTVPDAAIDPDDWRLEPAGRDIVVEGAIDAGGIDAGGIDAGANTPLVYGGGAWRGTITVEQFWTQLGRTEEPTTIDLTLAVVSAEAADQQWLDTRLTEAAIAGPDSFFEGVVSGNPGVVVVNSRGQRRHGSPVDADRHADAAARGLIDDILGLVLPALPDSPISIGGGWQTRNRSEQEGFGDRYTLAAIDGPIDGRIVELDVAGPAGAYFGDRYDGYWVDAEWSGTVTIDLTAAVPLAADLRAEGTIGFAVAGDRNGMETREWVHRLVLRTVPVDSSDG